MNALSSLDHSFSQDTITRHPDVGGRGRGAAVVSVLPAAASSVEQRLYHTLLLLLSPLLLKDKLSLLSIAICFSRSI